MRSERNGMQPKPDQAGGQRAGLVTARLVLAAALVLGAGGCKSIRDHRGFLVDPALVGGIQPGLDNQASVEKTLGRPTFVSQFGAPTWYYVSINTRQAAFRTPRSKDQLILMVNFDAQGRVASVERKGMEQVARLSPDGHRTPTLGRDRTFFEDLFGNIGQVGAAPGAAGPTTGGGRGPNGS